jgi:hypothetical protein
MRVMARAAKGDRLESKNGVKKLRAPSIPNLPTPLSRLQNASVTILKPPKHPFLERYVNVSERTLDEPVLEWDTDLKDDIGFSNYELESEALTIGDRSPMAPRINKSRGERTNYRPQLKRTRRGVANDGEEWFYKKAAFYEKIIYEGIGEQSPFKILQIDVQIEDLVREKQPIFRSAFFEDKNHKILTLINEPCVIVDKNRRFIAANIMDLNWLGDDEEKLHAAMDTLKKEDVGGRPADDDGRNKRDEPLARQWVYGYLFERRHPIRGPVGTKDTRNTEQ